MAAQFHWVASLPAQRIRGNSVRQPQQAAVAVMVQFHWTSRHLQPARQPTGEDGPSPSCPGTLLRLLVPGVSP